MACRPAPNVYANATSTGTTKWDMYFNKHERDGYIFAGFANSIDYARRTQTFTEMMESFRFLP